MVTTVFPCELHGVVSPPPSKSLAHRHLLCAALANGSSTLSPVPEGADCLATLSCLAGLGATYQRQGERLLLRGGGAAPSSPRFFCGESGSTLRFAIPLSLALSGGGCFTGFGRLLQRPLAPYEELFTSRGVLWRQKGSTLTISGRLTHGAYSLPGNISSQFFSGLLLALPLVEGDSVLTAATPPESADYITMTLSVLAQYGIAITQQGQQFFIPGGQRLRPQNVILEGDWSNAAFWAAANAVGHSVTLDGMNPHSLQGDSRISDLLRLSPPEIDLGSCPDLAPPLAAWGCMRKGRLTLSNAGRLRFKECDRLSAIAEVLSAMGAKITVDDSALVIEGQSSLSGNCTVSCHNDHRIAMMAAIAATRCRHPVTLLGSECVAKSYPAFWQDFQKLGGNIHEHTGA